MTDSAGSTYKIKNNYSSAATAWILQCHDADGQRWYWNDQELWLEPRPIEPGKEVEVKILPPMRVGPFGSNVTQCRDYQVMAVVFADGTVTGDLKWIEGVAAERRSDGGFPRKLTRRRAF